MNKEILNKIALARSKDPRKSMTVSDKLVKLQEEVGEIAAAHLKELGFKSHEKLSLKEIRDNKKEEYADALIVIYDMILADNFTFDEIKEELHKGVDKWYDKVKDLGKVIIEDEDMLKPVEERIILYFTTLFGENVSFAKVESFNQLEEFCEFNKTTKEFVLKTIDDYLLPF